MARAKRTVSRSGGEVVLKLPAHSRSACRKQRIEARRRLRLPRNYGTS
jgi:hypothetical protein